MGLDDRRDTNDKLEETLEETFPASDAPSNTVETGIRIGPDPAPASHLVVRDNREASRFEVAEDGLTAFLQYERRPAEFVLLHTDVPEPIRRRGIGSLLARMALQSARTEHLPIVVRCPFVREYLRKHR